MRPICAMCGRPTAPFVMIGNEAIGPKCARKAGFTKKTVKGSRVRYVGKAQPRPKGPQTMDLFEDQDL